MATNPYTGLAGFDEGFSKGLNLVWSMQDRKNAELDRQRKIEREDKLDAADAEERGLRRRKMEQEYEIAGKQEKRAEAMAPFEQRTKAAYAESIEESVREKRDQRKALGAKSRLEVLERTPHITNLLRDEQWRNDSTELDAFFNAGMSTPYMTAQGINDKSIGWFNKTYAPDLQKGVGDVIRDSTATEQNVPKGSKIIDKRVKSFEVDKKNRKAALTLEVTLQGPDGKEYKYDAPITKNRGDAPDDEVVVLDFEDLEQRIGAAGQLSKAVEDIGQQGGTVDDVVAFINKNTQNLYAKIRPETTSAYGKKIAEYARDNNVTPAEATKHFEDEAKMRQLPAQIANIRNNNPELSEAEIQRRARVAVGLEEDAGVPATATEPTIADGWKIEVVE